MPNASRPGELHGALEQFMEAKRVLIATGTFETPDGAGLLLNIGYAQTQTGRSERRAGAVYGGEEGVHSHMHA